MFAAPRPCPALSDGRSSAWCSTTVGRVRRRRWRYGTAVAGGAAGPAKADVPGGGGAVDLAIAVAGGAAGAVKADVPGGGGAVDLAIAVAGGAAGPAKADALMETALPVLAG